MTIRKRITACVLAVAFLCSLSAISVNAATVNLYAGQEIAKSAEVYGNFKVFYGHNDSNSAFSVYFTAKYKKGVVFFRGGQKLISRGQDCPSTGTAVLNEERYWRLELNPEGANHYGCIANGVIIND